MTVIEIINDDAPGNECVFVDQNGNPCDYKKEHRIVHLKDKKVNEHIVQAIEQNVAVAKSKSDKFTFELNGEVIKKLSTTELLRVDLIIKQIDQPEAQPYKVPFRDPITREQFDYLNSKVSA